MASNHQPADYKSAALPIELRELNKNGWSAGNRTRLAGLKVRCSANKPRSI